MITSASLASFSATSALSALPALSALASMISLASMATLDATALLGTVFLSVSALLLSALAMSESNLKSKQNFPHVACLQGRVGCGV
jgi:hypothetical protein